MNINLNVIKGEGGFPVVPDGFRALRLGDKIQEGDLMVCGDKWVTSPRIGGRVFAVGFYIRFAPDIHLEKGEWSDRNKVPTVHGKLSEALLD